MEVKRASFSRDLDSFESSENFAVRFCSGDRRLEEILQYPWLLSLRFSFVVIELWKRTSLIRVSLTMSVHIQLENFVVRFFTIKKTRDLRLHLAQRWRITRKFFSYIFFLSSVFDVDERTKLNTKVLPLAIKIRAAPRKFPKRSTFSPRGQKGKEVANTGRTGRRGFLSELVLYLTTHQRRVNAHLPTGVVCRQRKQASRGKSG